MIEIINDIREIYDFIIPCNELAPFVEFFSESSPEKCGLYFNKGHETVTMFQSWSPTFFINLTGSYQIKLNRLMYPVGKHQDILILRNNTVTRYNRPYDRIFTVKFYPGGLEAIGLNQTLIRDKMIDLNRILPHTLLELLKQPITFEERVELLQAFLLKSMSKTSKEDHYIKIVQKAIGEYTNSGMQLNTSQTAEKVFITSKTINRYFHRVIGVSPKSYFSVLRARNALTAMMNDKTNFSPWDSGYYDSSHFYKDIYNFTGYKLNDMTSIE